jgi:Flp pilus assembly protein TadD
MDQVVQPIIQDPLSGHPVGHAWAKGRTGDLREIRLAAALLILDKEPEEAAIRIVEASLASTTNPSLRGALLRSLLRHPVTNRQLADRYSIEVLTLFPDKVRAATFRVMTLREDKRFEEALAVLRAARKANPTGEPLLITEANLLSRMGRMDEAREFILQSVREGKESASILNTLAWMDVCLGQVTEQTAGWADRAVQLDKNKSILHTQACVQAELGQYTLARETLLQSMPEEGPIQPVTWFALGLIAQSLDEMESARIYYNRVDTGENREDPDDPITCKAVARKRLKAIGIAPS